MILFWIKIIICPKLCHWFNLCPNKIRSHWRHLRRGMTKSNLICDVLKLGHIKSIYIGSIYSFFSVFFNWIKSFFFKLYSALKFQKVSKYMISHSPIITLFLLYPIFAPTPFLFSLVTVSLLSISVSLILFCLIN